MDISNATDLVKRETYGILAQLEPNTGSLIPQLCEVRPLAVDGSSGYGTKEIMVGEMGELEQIKPGQPYPEDDFKIPWTAYARFLKFAKRLRIHEDDYAAVGAAGRIGDLIQNRIMSWALNWRDQKERRLIATYEAGALAAGSLEYFDGNVPEQGLTDPYPKFIYDSLPFFDTAHPLGYDASTTISNHNAGTGFSTANLKTVDAQFRDTIAVTDRGRSFTHRPTHILAPEQLRHSVLTVLNSQVLPGGTNAEINTTHGIVTPVFSNHFTDTDCWFLLRARYGFRAYDSGDIRPRIWIDENTKDIVVDVDSRFGLMVTNWRHGIANNIAAA